MSFTRFDERTVFSVAKVFDAGFGAGALSVITGQLFGSRVDACYLSNNDVIDHLVNLVLDDDAGHQVAAGGVNVPSGAGYTSVAIEAIKALVPTGEDGIVMAKDFIFEVNIAVAVTLTNQVGVFVAGGHF